MLATIHIEPPWTGHNVPELNFRSVFHSSPWWESIATQILNELVTLFTENMEWLILSLVVIAAVGFGAILWAKLHPGPGPGPRGEQQLPGVKWG